jgi:hypothetical protein
MTSTLTPPSIPITSSNRTKRPFSLPRLIPNSPFVLNTFTSDPPYSPLSDTEEPVGSPRVAHIAGRSCAGLIRLDMNGNMGESRYVRKDTPVDRFLDVGAHQSSTRVTTHQALQTVLGSSDCRGGGEGVSPLSPFHPTPSLIPDTPFLTPSLISPLSGQTSMSTSPASVVQHQSTLKMPDTPNNRRTNGSKETNVPNVSQFCLEHFVPPPAEVVMLSIAGPIPQNPSQNLTTYSTSFTAIHATHLISLFQHSSSQP